MGVSGQRHAPTALYTRGKDPGTHCTGGWVGPKAGLDSEVTVKILLPLPGIEPGSPGRPVRSQDTRLTELPVSKLWYQLSSNTKIDIKVNEVGLLLLSQGLCSVELLTM
jgi:hypothetical protein